MRKITAIDRCIKALTLVPRHHACHMAEIWQCARKDLISRNRRRFEAHAKRRGAKHIRLPVYGNMIPRHAPA